VTIATLLSSNIVSVLRVAVSPIGGLGRPACHECPSVSAIKQI